MHLPRTSKRAEMNCAPLKHISMHKTVTRQPSGRTPIAPNSITNSESPILWRRDWKATKDNDKAIRFDPNDASYFSNLGTAYFSTKKWTKAAQAYEHALSLD